MSVIPGGSSSERPIWVETLRTRVTGGQQVRVANTPFLVRRARQETGSNAGSYVKCELGDQTGWIEGIWWSAAKLPRDELETLLSAQTWSVDGTAHLHRYGGRETPQIKLESARPVLATDPCALSGLVRRSASTEEEVGDWLSSCISQLRNVPLRLLLEHTLGSSGIWRALYLQVPAGLYYHHAYQGGLADHVREMGSVWLASLPFFPKVDRDLALAGILLHDVGKLDTFEPGPAPQLARAGRFVDHITAGIARLSLAIDTIPGFPPLLRDHLLHVVASHHGEKEYGSPVVPATREAIVVHHLDRLTSLLSHFEEWNRQSGVDRFGWTSENSPWLKARLGARSEIPNSLMDGDDDPQEDRL